MSVGVRSPVRASGGASALNGAWLIILSCDLVFTRSSVSVMLGTFALGRWWSRCVVASVVAVLEGGVAALIEGADALDAVRVDRRAPVGLHHDRDRLLDGLSLAELHGALDRLYGGR